jgi:hypothetical protein
VCSMFSGVIFCLDFNDAPPKTLKNSNVNPKMKTTEEERIRVCSFTRNIFEVKKVCCSFEMRTTKSDK